ncbi:MAG: hypothetical protein SVV67_05160 [Bacillota bacterium]|nr:hypothetical protein [Bacillota bacterium]
MPTLQVRNLPEHIYRRIVERARAKRSSITQETIYLLQKALEMNENPREQRDLLVDQMMTTAPSGGNQWPDPVLMVREDRER